MADTFGKDTLIPVPRLEEQGKVKLLQLVVMQKKRGLHFRIKGSYHPTDFQLTDVLQDSSQIDVAKTTSVLVHQYKIGNLFGKLVKTEIKIKKLMEELKKRKVDLKHSFIKQVRQDDNKVLCLVTEVFHLAQKVNVETNKELDLESKAAVAYNVNELNISMDGSMDLGLHQGFRDPSVDQGLKVYGSTPDKVILLPMTVSKIPLTVSHTKCFGRYTEQIHSNADFVSDNVIFSEYCQKMADTFGKDTLIPVLSLDEQGKVKLLQLVIKKKRKFFFWTTYSYRPTDFQLTDVLQDSCQIDVAETTLVQDQYEDFFWKLVKTEVKIKELMEELKKRKVDLKPSFFKQVREDENTVLCLVTGVVHVAKERMCGNLVSEAAISEKVNVETNKELDLASKAAVAYNVNELNISKDGSMDLWLHRGFHDPSVEYDDAYSSSDLHNQVSGSVMFSAACQQLVNSLGKGTVIPVQSLDEQSKVKMYQLVVMEKKRNFFFFTKCSYHPTEFKLKDILKGCPDISVEETDKDLFLNYSNEVMFPRTEKVDVTDFDPDTSDTWTIQAKFGKVVKTEVDKIMLMETLVKRKVDLKHPFIKQVRQDENKVLCVITGVVHLAKERHTDKCENLNSKAEASAKILLTLSNTEVDAENKKVLGLVSNTAIAYNVNELKIGLEDGSMEMILALGLPWGLSGFLGL